MPRKYQNEPEEMRYHAEILSSMQRVMIVSFNEIMKPVEAKIVYKWPNEKQTIYEAITDWYCESCGEVHLTMDMMKKEHFNNLPEFEGF